MDGGDIAALVTATSGALFGVASWWRTRQLDQQKADQSVVEGFTRLVRGLERRSDDCEKREESLRKRVERLESQ